MKAYKIEPGGVTIPMEQVICQNEEAELQSILECNPNLLPGDQVNPHDPRRWLLVKREMPVPDPSTGDNRWSIDFFFVDQSGMPTFVECKRKLDSRSRREVVGQMLDYAANGHHYWTKGEIQRYAAEAAAAAGTSLENRLTALQPDGEPETDEFFQSVEEQLRAGKVRMVFFLEEAPMELRSIVEFMNKQMELAEVLLVEAKQFEHAGFRVVIPSLFGYTEEARAIKREVKTVYSSGRRSWDEASFFEDLESRFEHEDVQPVRTLYEASLLADAKVKWGTGKTKGSFTCKWPSSLDKSVFAVFSDGKLAVYLSHVAEVGNEELAEWFRDMLSSELSLTMPDTVVGQYPEFQFEDWSEHADRFFAIVQELLEKHRLRAEG